MKKIPAKDLIDFRRRSNRGKKNFVERLKSTKIEPPSDGGGDYWVSALSAIVSSFKDNDPLLIDEKIEELKEKIDSTSISITRKMYQQNIAVLQNYKTLDLKKLRPTGTLNFLKKSSGTPLLTIKGLQIQTKPSLIYTFGKEDELKVGAVWFTAKIEGYTIEEVGLFCEMLQRFLRHNYSKKYEVSSKYCVSVEMLSRHLVSHAQIEAGTVPASLIKTLDEINRLI